jgi:hypothetical protein
VRRFLNNRREHRRLETELRANLSRTQDDFVETLAQELETTERRRSGSLRFVLAGGLTAAMLAALGAFGALGYGASLISPAVHAVKVVKQSVGPAKHDANSIEVQSSSASQDQYKFLVCHHPPGNPSNYHTISVGSQAAVDAHVRNHPGDHPGPCVPPNG